MALTGKSRMGSIDESMNEYFDDKEMLSPAER